MTDIPTAPAAEQHGGQPPSKGLKVGAIGLVSAMVDRGRLDGTRLQPGGVARAS